MCYAILAFTMERVGDQELGARYFVETLQMLYLYISSDYPSMCNMKLYKM